MNPNHYLLAILGQVLRQTHADRGGGDLFEEWLAATSRDEEDSYYCEAVVLARAEAGEYPA